MIAFLSSTKGLNVAAMAGIVSILALAHGHAERPELFRPPSSDIQISTQPLKPRIPVDVIRVIDGDTVEVRAHIWIDQHVITKVRLRSIDAPEMKGRCASETRQAEQARDQLVAQIGAGPAFLTDLGRDKYGGRVLGSLLTTHGDDIGPRLIAAGHARPYAGGRRQDWC